MAGLGSENLFGCICLQSNFWMWGVVTRSRMKTKEEIVRNWLPRYTGLPLHAFQPHVLLTNFQSYLELFCTLTGAEIANPSANMPSASCEGITMINFGIGSPNAATIMDLLQAVPVRASLFLGKCGGLHESFALGDFILPVAAIRHEGTSDNYFPPEVPALPTFNLQRATAEIVQRKGCDYWAGTVLTTNRRVWEFDQHFKEYLGRVQAVAVDMECATLFTVGAYNQIANGALLLISDQPMIAEGIKTQESDRRVNLQFAERHIQIGIDTLQELERNASNIRKLRF